MISKLYNSWQLLRGSLWFVPALFCIGYFLLTLGLYQAEYLWFSEVELPSLFFSGDYADAKSVILALLSSMITMTTLAISITMVVLSLAANQLGPRLIRSFMSDRKTQYFIGVFFGTVIACFVLTLILHTGIANASDAAPRLTMSGIFALCFTNLFVLLAFVHHVAQSSIADQVILKVTNELMASLQRLTNNEPSSQTPLDHQSSPFRFSQAPDYWPTETSFERLYPECCGYVQHIDYERLLLLAEQYECYIHIDFKAGHFLVEGESGIQCASLATPMTAALKSQLLNCFIIGDTRTPTQDIAYSIRHLVEIGIRAQSPGMNDNFTAINVLDRLSSAMAVLFQQQLPSPWFTDRKGITRIWSKQNNEAELIFAAFEQMRHNADDKPDVIMHLLHKLAILAELAHSPCQREGLQQQLAALKQDVEQLPGYVVERTKMQALCQTIQQRLTD